MGVGLFPLPVLLFLAPSKEGIGHLLAILFRGVVDFVVEACRCLVVDE